MKKLIIIFAMVLSFSFINDAKANPLTQIGNEILVGIAKRTILPVMDDYAGQILIMIGQKSPYIVDGPMYQSKVEEGSGNKIVPYSIRPNAQIPESVDYVSDKDKPSMKIGFINIYVR